MAFEAELATYERNKESWLAENSEGQYVVIRGEEVLGRYPTYQAAFEQGVQTYGRDTPFLIKQILPDDPVMFSPPFGTSHTNFHSLWQYSTQGR
jgi:hypothetical protein